MGVKLLVLLFICLFVPKSFVCEKKQCAKVEKYDYLQLVLTWGPGYCKFNNRCKRFSEKWTIHGTWPEHRSKSATPQFCCGEALSRSAIDTIYDELNTNWQSLNCKQCNSFQFWRHEWRKHGLCSSFTKDLRGPLNYFNKTLDLFKSLPLTEVFVNTTPIAEHSNGTVYEFDDLLNAFHNKIGARIRCKCHNIDPHSNITILSEAFICYNSETLKPVDCPKRSNCKERIILLKR